MTKLYPCHTYPERERMEAHGWSLGGARPRWGSPRRARAAAAPRPGTAPSSAPPRSRPPTRWPDAGPPTRAACGRRGYARSSREREREREQCRTRMPGRKETAASAKEQNSVRWKAAATPGSQSKSSRKLQTTDESNLIESQTQANWHAE